MAVLKPGHYAALAAAAGLVGWLAWSQFRSTQPTGGLFAPPAQPPADNDLYRMGQSPDPSCPCVVPRAQHHEGYTYTKHRYPRAAGGEITAVIHRGFSPMRIPAVADVQWMIAPPSEVMWLCRRRSTPAPPAHSGTGAAAAATGRCGRIRDRTGTARRRRVRA